MATLNTSVLARALIFAGFTALAACSGQGSQNAFPLGTQAQSVTHSTQSVSPNAAPNPYPTTQGTTWTYAYSLVLANSPGKVTNTTGTIATTLDAPTTFNGYSVLDYHSVFNYSVPSGGVSGTTITDDYQNFTSKYYYDYGHMLTGSESGTTPAYSNTSSNTQTFNVSPFILDIFPESDSNKAAEPGAYTLTAKSTSSANGGTSVTEDYARNADGSSTTTETITLAGKSYPYDETINNDYSATQTNGLPGQSNTGSTTFSAPANDKVTVVYTPPSGPVVTTLVPVWWGTTALLSDEFKQVASAEAVPAKCKSSYTGQKSVHLTEALSYVEPVEGFTDNETIDHFVISGIGVVCITNTRLIEYYANTTSGMLAGTTTIAVNQGLTAFAPSRTKGHQDIAGFGIMTGGISRPMLPLGVNLEKFSGAR
jgi:hypothetical protein